MAREIKDGKKAVQEKKSFSIGTLKDTLGLSNAVKFKPVEYMKLGGAIPGTHPIFDATGIYGPPLGFVSRVQGHSNTGKTTLVIAIIKWCQENGVLPIIEDTEGNFSFKHAEEGGMKIDWVPDEDGELHPTGDFIFINNYTLWELIGKERAKGKRTVTTIEDLAHFNNEINDKQVRGEIPMPVCYIWDAMGTLGCDASIEGKNHNNMWDAAAVNLNFRDFWFQTIPNSRMMDSPYTNTMVVVAKIRHDMSGGGMGATEIKGGKILVQASRMGFQLGNSIAAGTKAMVATFGGRDTQWGIQVNLKIVKNHVEGASFEGKIISTPHGFIAATTAAQDEYRKLYKKQLLHKLEAPADAEIQFSETTEVG